MPTLGKVVFYFGFCGVKYHIYKTCISCQTDIWNCLSYITSCLQIHLTLPAEFIPLHTHFYRTVCPESDIKRLRACNSLNPVQTRPNSVTGDAPKIFLILNCT